MSLTGKVALITGGSYGVGKGIVDVLSATGATVYYTSRQPRHSANSPANVIPVHCDHRNDLDLDRAFKLIEESHKSLDILVNNVWGGYEDMVVNGEFTWQRPFWQQPIARWDAMFQAGVRAHYLTSQYAARRMTAQQSGLIVNISFWSAQKYIGNVAYGVSKAATDKMTADMAQELRDYNVAVVSLYPGMVRTEKVMATAAYLDLSNSESPQFIGRAVAALFNDKNIMNKTGRVLVAAALALEYGFTDIDGKQPRPLTIDDV